MKKLFAAALAALVVFFATPVRAQLVPLIEATVGSGSKTAHLVLDFGGTQFFTFAYKFDGTQVTAGDMIAAVDASLSSFVASLPGNRDSGFGRFASGFGYGTNLLSSFTANFSTPPFFGWSYYVAQSPLTSVLPGWSTSAYGIDGRDGNNPAGTFQNLDTHAWHGFSWGQYDSNTFAFQGSAPRVAVAAPEPGTLLLVLPTLVGLVAWRRGTTRR